MPDSEDRKPARPSQPREESECAESRSKAPDVVPLAVIGASAGGLEALKEFFAAAPERGGCAYLVIVHLGEKSKSLLARLLQKLSALPVAEVRDGEIVEVDRVYLVPPGREVGLYQGRFEVLDRSAEEPWLPINHVMKSVALELGDMAAGAVLSGTGTDGSLGLAEIRARGGLALVESPERAKFAGMPKSAIDSGAADDVLAPIDMPRRIVSFLGRGSGVRGGNPGAFLPAMTFSPEQLDKILVVLRDHFGHDFTLYKKSTLARRLERRMRIQEIDTIEHYARYLRESPQEAASLLREFLIGVTAFFRDEEAFNYLLREALPGRFDELGSARTLRAWVPACATGEEAYSVAIVLREYLDSLADPPLLRVYATDIDERAIEKARAGRYPRSAFHHVDRERLARFFSEEDGTVRVKKALRERLVFSVQNVMTDPPFSRLHLVSCRNLLIYFEKEAQNRLIPLLHHVLEPKGLLMLGSSETIGSHTRLFEALDANAKVFACRQVEEALLPDVHFPTGSPRIAASLPDPTPAARKDPAELGKAVRRILLRSFAPPAVVATLEGDILHYEGKVSEVLEPPSGPPSRSLLEQARPGLRIEISSALREAHSKRAPVKRREIELDAGEKPKTCDLHVMPIPGEENGDRLLVVFELSSSAAGASAERSESAEESEARSGGVSEGAPARRIAQLEEELSYSRKNYQNAIEELEASNEELKSLNEELQSSNEELQSTNEELESSKEELKALNDEFRTSNADMEHKLGVYRHAFDDLHNLLYATQIATIFVDMEKRVRRFNDEAAALVKLRPNDEGRPLDEVATNFEENERFFRVLEEVLSRLITKEAELKTTSGEWVRLSVHPYLTNDRRVEGAVLTLVSIDAEKKAQEVLEELLREKETDHALMRDVFDMHREPLAVLDADGRVVIANTAFSGLFSSPRLDTPRSFFRELAGGDDASTALVGAIDEAMREGKDFLVEGQIFERDEAGSSWRVIGRIVHSEERPYRLMLRFEVAMEPSS